MRDTFPSMHRNAQHFPVECIEILEIKTAKAKPAKTIRILQH